MSQKQVRWMVSASEEELFCVAASQGLVDIWSFYLFMAMLKFFADLCQNKVHFSSLACPFPIW
jgi:hypothetical protein